jgi:hypothetical protein
VSIPQRARLDLAGLGHRLESLDHADDRFEIER